jgi:hypothetical protein
MLGEETGLFLGARRLVMISTLRYGGSRALFKAFAKTGRPDPSSLLSVI